MKAAHALTALLMLSTAFASDFKLKSITWDSAKKGELQLSASITPPEGQHITPLSKQGVLVADAQRPNYICGDSQQAAMSYRISSAPNQKNGTFLFGIHLAEIPESGTIRINDSISFQSYTGLEESPATLIKPRVQGKFYFHGYCYTHLLHRCEGKSSLRIGASGKDPDLVSIKILNQEGKVLHEQGSISEKYAIGCSETPHSIVLIRKIGATRLDIPLQAELIIPEKLRQISQGSLPMTLKPELANPEQNLSIEEQDILKQFTFMSLGHWYVNLEEDGNNHINLVYRAPENTRPDLKIDKVPFEQFSYYLEPQQDDPRLKRSNVSTQNFDNQVSRLYISSSDCKAIVSHHSIPLIFRYGESLSPRYDCKLDEPREFYFKGIPYRMTLQEKGENYQLLIEALAPTPMQERPTMRVYDKDGKKMVLNTNTYRYPDGKMKWEPIYKTQPSYVQFSGEAGSMNMSLKLNIDLELPYTRPLNDATKTKQ